MEPSELSLQIGDLVMLRHGATLPPNCHVESGTIGRVLLLNDAKLAAMTVQFINSGPPVLVRRHDLMSFVGTPPMEAPAAPARGSGDHLEGGDLVELLAVSERPPGQPAAPRRYGRVLEETDENGRVAIQVEGRQHPLHLSVQPLRRVD